MIRVHHVHRLSRSSLRLNVYPILQIHKFPRCSDLASAVWLLTATYLELPVSTTHSTVGGVIGFALVAGGGSAIIWTQKIDEFPGFTGVVTIVLSWVTSPFISMLVALFLFLLVRLLILRRKNSFMLVSQPGL